MGCFSTNVEAPPPAAPSAEEKALQQTQLEMLKAQQAQTELVKPYLYKSMGLSESVDPATGKTILVENPKSEADLLNDEIEKLYLSRQKQALEGTLPVSPALETDLATQESQLSEELSRRLGPNWQTSTPGIQAMGEFKKRADLLREEARRGQITTGEGMLINRLNQSSADQAKTYSQAYQAPQLYTGVLGNYQAAMAPYQQERMAVYNNNVSAAMQSAANKGALWSGLIGATGYTLGNSKMIRG